MRYILFFVACTVFGTGYTQYPQFEWGGSVGGNLNDRATCVAVDGNDNVYFAGSFSGELFSSSPPPGPVDLDPGTSVVSHTTNGLEDIFLAKLDVNGNLIWVKTWGGAYSDLAHSVEVSQSGYVYLAGTFTDSIDFDPGVGVHYASPISGHNFILKLDDNGNFVWVKNYGRGIDIGQAFSYDMTIDQDENIYSTGIFYDTVDFDPGSGVNLTITNFDASDYFIQKLDSAGNFVWAGKGGALYGKLAHGIDVDTNGNVVVAGGHLASYPWPNGTIPDLSIFY